MSSNKANGFTLIELLVVIAIIAILAAILFPVFMTARESARTANCIATIKQVGAACSNYIDDFNGTYPWSPLFRDGNHSGNNTRGYPVGQYWGGDTGREAMLSGAEYDGIPEAKERPLWKYTKNVMMFRCPSEPKQMRAGNVRYTDFEWWGNSYPMNAAWDCSNLPGGVGIVACMAGTNVVDGGVKLRWGRKADTVRRVSKLVLAGDRALHSYFWSPHTTDEGWRNHHKTLPKSVALFADGHVKLITMTPSHEVRVGGQNVKTEGVWDEEQGWALMEKGWIPGNPTVGAP